MLSKTDLFEANVRMFSCKTEENDDQSLLYKWSVKISLLWECPLDILPDQSLQLTIFKILIPGTLLIEKNIYFIRSQH